MFSVGKKTAALPTASLSVARKRAVGTAGLIRILLVVFAISAGTTYYLVAIDKLNVVTGMLLLSAASTVVLLITELLLKLLNVATGTKNNIRLSLVTTIVMIFTMELFLRFVGKYSNYYEKNGHRNYVSLYANNDTSWFRLYHPNAKVNWLEKEFSHVRETNSLGLAEREINQGKAAQEYRIIALGDSFTEGVGTSYDTTWVKVAERRLSEYASNRNITMINAGISGSDVYFEYMLLRNKLMSFSPDLVIIVVNHSDVDDILIRGGQERFLPNGKIAIHKRGPTWEWAYGISYIFRHIVHDILGFNWMLLTPTEMKTEEQISVKNIRRSIGDFSKLASNNHLRILFVFQPHEIEVRAGQYFPTAFNKLVDDLKASNQFCMVDLLEYYRARRIITKERASEFFWITDLHHNTKGYEAMGNAIADTILATKFVSGTSPECSASVSFGQNRPRYDYKEEDKWRMQAAPGNVAQMIFPDGQLNVVRIAISRADTKVPWHIQLNNDRISIKSRTSYVLRFKARADQVRNIVAAVSKGHDPWDTLGLYKAIGLTQTWQPFELEFRAIEDDDNARIHFDVGGDAASVELSDVALSALPQ